jgi:hypothetical protein
MNNNTGLLARIKPIAKVAAILMLIAIVGGFVLYCAANAVWLDNPGR